MSVSGLHARTAGAATLSGDFAITGGQLSTCQAMTFVEVCPKTSKIMLWTKPIA